LTLSGCAELPYYWQSINGHVQVLQSAKPVQAWISDPSTSPLLKERLMLSQRLREFASSALALPDNASYRSYADIRRNSVVWNVVAAAPWSLTLKTWCFPVMGCVGYRGYFDETQARAYAASLRGQGLEVKVYGVAAYSTLGWLNWMESDPLLNTFIYYPQGELARMIFHELAHQVAYVADDTRFNESFATAVERMGAAQWMRQHGSTQVQAEFADQNARRAQFLALTRATRRALADIYAGIDTMKQPDPGQMAAKDKTMQEFRERYAALRASWSANHDTPPLLLAGYDAWVREANNAAFGAHAAYDDLVPQFEALFVNETRGLHGTQAWEQFLKRVRKLQDLPASERTLLLSQQAALVQHEPDIP
jgi:predicted aminopeptidase